MRRPPSCATSLAPSGGGRTRTDTEISLQASQGGAAYFAGKGIKNSAEKQEAAVAGAIAAAHYIRSIAPMYGIPVIRTYSSLLRLVTDY